MKNIIAVICLALLTSCSSYNSNRRKEDREYTKRCIADLYNEGLSGDLSIKACKELSSQ